MPHRVLFTAVTTLILRSCSPQYSRRPPNAALHAGCRASGGYFGAEGIQSLLPPLPLTLIAKGRQSHT